MSISDDEDEFLAELEAANRRSALLHQKLGTMKHPEMIRTENVFGTPCTEEVLRRNCQVAEMLRDRKRRMEVEKDVAELRRQVDAQVQTTQREEIIECLDTISSGSTASAEQNERAGQIEAERPQMEANPILAKFVVMPNWPRFSEFSIGTEATENPLIQYMSKLRQSDAESITCVRHLVKHYKRYEPVPDTFLRILFLRSVYDTSLPNCQGHTTRATEIDVLSECLSDFTGVEKKPVIPGMQDTLANFGWVSGEGETGPRGCAAAKVFPECLDGQVLHSEKPFDKELMKSIRNLGRAFSIWCLMVKSNFSLSQIYDSNAQTEDFSDEWLYHLEIVKLCAEVLLTPFGSQLSFSIGELISSVLERVSDECWSSFRRRLSQHVMDVTPFFPLQADLAAGCLPYTSIRACTFTLDFSFMLLKVWLSGPACKPDVSRFQWPESGNERGISFNLSDVVTLTEEFPTITKRMNCVWACMWATLLKHVLLIDSPIVGTIQTNECVRLQKTMKHMKRCSHRLPFGLQSKKFSLAIDSALISFGSFAKAEKPDAEFLKSGLGLGVATRASPGAFDQPRKKQKKVTDFFKKSPS